MNAQERLRVPAPGAHAKRWFMPVHIGHTAGTAASRTQIINLFNARYLARIMRRGHRAVVIEGVLRRVNFHFRAKRAVGAD
jgi:hypothetical protein